MSTPVGYSYVRFSHPDQAKGDSLRRQTEAALDWCKRSNVTLDTSTKFSDLGKSAFLGEHRKNPERHALAAFLRMVEDGKVPRGSYLIIENLDRLTREHLQSALLLVLNLLQSGIRIVQLKPSEIVFDDKSDTMPVMLMIMELARGHSESAMKSERVGKAWDQKRREARAQRAVLTTRGPAWLEVVGRVRVGKRARGGKFRILPERVRVVKLIFEWACNGLGVSLIVQRLTALGIEPWGRGRWWSKAYVGQILRGRAVRGEYQPRRGGQKDGAAIANYYPVVIEEALWERAQHALDQRKDNPGRVGLKVANLFTGMLRDAATQSKLLVAWQTRGSGQHRQQRRVLVSADSTEGRAKSVSFPYDVFEAAVLSLLKEVKPAEVLGEEPPSESADLAGQLATVEGRMRKVESELVGDGDDVPALARVLRSLDQKRQDLQKRLAAARQKESNPRSVAWAETQSLLDVARDEASRLRLRGLLRGIIDEAWVLVVPMRSHRLAVVQFFFSEGKRRDYLIHYHAAGRNRKGGWSSRSMADSAPKGLDLRKPDHARRLEKALREGEIPEKSI
jgi:DNA invertase Pin-like site-specific DNA recombinase